MILRRNIQLCDFAHFAKVAACLPIHRVSGNDTVGTDTPAGSAIPDDLFQEEVFKYNTQATDDTVVVYDPDTDTFLFFSYDDADGDGEYDSGESSTFIGAADRVTGLSFMEDGALSDDERASLIGTSPFAPFGAATTESPFADDAQQAGPASGPVGEDEAGSSVDHGTVAESPNLNDFEDQLVSDYQ